MWLWDAFAAVGVGLAALLKVFLPVVLWVGVGHYYLQFPLEVTLLAYIALQITALCLAQAWAAAAPQAQLRGFYTVEHLAYDLVLKEYPGSHGTTRVMAERGPMFAGRSDSFSDYGAAKAYFDYLEGMDPGVGCRGVESVNLVYVVTGGCKPPPIFPKDDKPRGILIHATPFSEVLARRKEACEEHGLVSRVAIADQKPDAGNWW
jgi:hypothetical protein